MSIESFIERWRGLVGGAERADYQMFLSELCDALDLPRPNPAGAAALGLAYRFEHPALRALARLGYAQPTPDGRAYTARRAA